MSRSKKNIKVGDKVIFSTGNFAGLTGIVQNVDWDSINPNAIYGFYHTVLLSNGNIGHIEKSEHWELS
jgi:transcription antitermination factor NusG